ncbi:hypothetical protein IPH92_03235 [Candidatus Kaiserbacteria bacterium]|nr:MAG: hypothetical protein IPH92_03235 [Candidatus Kaiserbacteria bacterium]
MCTDIIRIRNIFMFNTQNTQMTAGTKMVLGMGLALLSIIAVSLPLFANAASYAYVDAQGEVRSITAPDWRTAINTAPNIHMHSGVLLLSTAADFTIVGDDVKAF